MFTQTFNTVVLFLKENIVILYTHRHIVRYTNKGITLYKTCLAMGFNHQNFCFQYVRKYC